VSSWAHTGNYDVPRRLTSTASDDAVRPANDVGDAQVVAELRQHREDAARSPEALRVAGLGTRGPKSRAWQVLS
jgi:hypothetical protein